MESSHMKGSTKETGKRIRNDDTIEELMKQMARIFSEPDSLILSLVVEFSTIEVALVNKAFLKATTRMAASMLSKTETDHCVDHTWKLRLSRFVFQNYVRYYERNPTVPTTFFTPNARLLWKTVPTCPLVQQTLPQIGPSVVLPNGNLAMALEDNSCISILDTKQMTWTRCTSGAPGGFLFDPHRLPFPPIDAIAQRMVDLVPSLIEHALTVPVVAQELREGGIPLLGQVHRNNSELSWISDHLFYSEGHFVLHQSNISGLFIHHDFLHVWKIQEEGQDIHTHHLYTKDLKGNCMPAGHEPAMGIPPPPQGENASSFKSLIVAADGVFYCLRESNGTAHTGVSYLIQKYEVGTGNCLAMNTVCMPQVAPGARQPRYTTTELHLCDDYIWFSRRVEEEGPFPGIGLGLYSFSRINLSQKSFLPSFEEGETIILNPTSGPRYQNWILVYLHSESRAEKFSIDEAGAFAREIIPDHFGRHDIMYVSGNSAFGEIDHDSDGYVQLEEFGVATGERVRTLSTEMSTRGQVRMVASVHSNAWLLFCIISAGAGDGGIIQTFLI